MFGIPVPQIDVPVWIAKHGMKIAKALLVVALVVGWTWGAVKYGENEAYMEVAQEQAKERAKQLEALAKEAQERMPIIEAAGARQAKTEARVDKGRKLLDEAITKGGNKPACDLTDDELRAYEQILGNQKD